MSLSEFHEWVREIVRSACEEALHDENFEPDPSDNIEEGSLYIHHLVTPCTYFIIW